MIIILGIGRSGTTWLAKIFDSHPDTLYRHEPDAVLHDDAIPLFPTGAEVDRYRDATARYLDDLMALNDIRPRGSLPVFVKSYRGPVARAALRAWIMAVKGLQQPFPKWPMLKHAPVPDFVSPGDRDRVRYVFKSVSCLYRAKLLLSAKPDAKILHIVRHPCGYVSSQLRGMQLKLMLGGMFLNDMAARPEAQRYGFTLQRLQAMTFEEQMAAMWVIHNDRAMADLTDDPNYRLVVYEDLCRRPFEVAKDLLLFCGLPWSDATDAFLHQCVDHRGDNERYFQIIRSPIKAAIKWQQELTADQIERVMRVVAPTRPGELYADRDVAVTADALSS